MQLMNWRNALNLILGKLLRWFCQGFSSIVIKIMLLLEFILDPKLQLKLCRLGNSSRSRHRSYCCYLPSNNCWATGTVAGLVVLDSVSLGVVLVLSFLTVFYVPDFLTTFFSRQLSLGAMFSCSLRTSHNSDDTEVTAVIVCDKEG